MTPFTGTKVGKFLGNIGIKPFTDLVAGSNGLISALKEGKDPNAKISSRRGGALIFIGAAVSMATTIDYMNKGQLITMLFFAALGAGLLAITSFNSSK